VPADAARERESPAQKESKMSLPIRISEATRRLNPGLFGGAQNLAPNLNLENDGAKPRLKQNRGPKMNKTEAAFDAHLRATFVDSQIEREGVTLLIGNGVRYTADFSDFAIGGKLTLWEVKGFMREDAAVKIKIAARVYPRIAFFLATRNKDKGLWNIERVHS